MRPFAITIVVVALAAFLMPAGYQTSLMDYGPDGCP
jgi:di/tricarboxylate transporter